MKSLMCGPRRRPDVIFHRSGRIEISARVSQTLGLVSGDSVDVMQEGREYYLVVHKRPAGPMPAAYQATVRPSKAGSGHMRAQCRALVLGVLGVLGGGSRAALSAGEPVDDGVYGRMVPLIMRRGV